jgi:hypothetical protein
VCVCVGGVSGVNHSGIGNCTGMNFVLTPGDPKERFRSRSVSLSGCSPPLETLSLSLTHTHTHTYTAEVVV